MLCEMWSRLAYLSEEGGKFPECLDPWLIEGTQQRKHHQLLRPEVCRQFYDFQQCRTMIIVAPGMLWRRE
jgi:hypothetical protein